MDVGATDAYVRLYLRYVPAFSELGSRGSLAIFCLEREGYTMDASRGPLGVLVDRSYDTGSYLGTQVGIH